ncbi:Inner membrane protein YpjD [Ephemeroptericola cinctiostellae]|uniref:Inner membrane protein YpjD n=1 Tax=Ephemeroptericola cinctiostellae TaxID=2268024 RepID=A0A345D964_9BURK|nr:cytochrome c biogenesis protein CcsA [Ephemeroptericola cinctiostellae]AXF84902.1 Inner membrane protein YpjD [Ephemeroptericola cinctiostellae]
MNQTLLYLARSLLGALLLAGVCSAPSIALATDAVAVALPPVGVLPFIHIAIAIATTFAFVTAFGVAILLWVQTRRLHDIRGGQGASSWLDRVPPVLSLERILFRVLWIGFVLLSVLVLSGMFFGEQVWGRPLVLSHKVVFTTLAWALFGVLLAGRSLAGWRGLTAVRATIFGFALLFLAYAGTHFVMDVVLKRQ